MNLSPTMKCPNPTVKAPTPTIKSIRRTVSSTRTHVASETYGIILWKGVTHSFSVTSLTETSIPIVNAACHGTTAGNTMIRFPPMIYPKE